MGTSHLVVILEYIRETNLKNSQYFMPYTKIHSEWITGLNGDRKTITLLEENTRELLDPGLGMTLKAQSLEKLMNQILISSKMFALLTREIDKRLTRD